MASSVDCSLVQWDVPYAPTDERKTRRLRTSKGLPPDRPTGAENPQLRELIDKIIPPRKWTDQDGTEWVQHASDRKSVLLDAVTLKEALEVQLEREQCRDTGVSLRRRELYSECFSEICRQVLTENMERGLLLLKLKAERELTISAYEAIFQSRMSYAARAAMKGEKVNVKVLADIERLKVARVQLVAEEDRLRQACEEATKRGDELLKDDEKKNRDDITAVNKEGAQKRAQLEMLTQPVKK